MHSKYTRYVILLNDNTNKTTTKEIVKAHVQHLKDLDKQEKLILCGPFTNYAGGMIIIKATNLDEAKQIAESDPFIKEGVRSYELRVLELSCKENNHMGMG